VDSISAWLHNRNIDRTLDRLGTYVDPHTRMTLLKFLIAEENKLGDGRSHLKRTERRIRAHEGRIERMLAVIERLSDQGLMDQETLSKAVAVVTAMRDSQVLLEQLYRRLSEAESIARTRP
jgi:hypothetical protein